MRAMQKVAFYTKLNCGLCDEAYSMLMQLTYDIPMDIDIIDITHNYNKLNGNYDERIPVISTLTASNELNWPFTLADLRRYLTT